LPENASLLRQLKALPFSLLYVPSSMRTAVTLFFIFGRAFVRSISLDHCFETYHFGIVLERKIIFLFHAWMFTNRQLIMEGRFPVVVRRRGGNNVGSSFTFVSSVHSGGCAIAQAARRRLLTTETRV
jgi:hypothetical protein